MHRLISRARRQEAISTVRPVLATTTMSVIPTDDRDSGRRHDDR
jgi:hypothetical protein